MYCMVLQKHEVNNDYIHLKQAEVVEESTLTQRDMEETEDHVSVSMLRLMGVPMEIRHAIYREVLGELQAVHDFSVGTVHMLTNVIDWVIHAFFKTKLFYPYPTLITNIVYSCVLGNMKELKTWWLKLVSLQHP